MSTSQTQLPAPFQTEKNQAIHFTTNDYKTLMALVSVADEYGRTHISNISLGGLIGTRAPAAASRLFRLERLGLISIAYDHSASGRKIVGRAIRVLKVPPAPFSPQEAQHGP